MNVDTRMQDYSGLVREFVDYLRERKAYWLAPLIFVFLMLAGRILSRGKCGRTGYLLHFLVVCLMVLRQACARPAWFRMAAVSQNG